MPYTPVPAIAAGDTIDEVFLMTYWVDNMAAMIPDMFSAKGQLAVGLGVDSMGILSVGTDGYSLVADSTQVTGLKWDARSKITLFETFPAVSGMTTTVGSQTITAATAISGVPATAKAIFLRAYAQWSDASLNPNIYFERTIGYQGFSVDGQVNNKMVAGNGLVPLSSGTFLKRIIWTSPSVFGANCQGYIE
jgi:hypothetical protein